MSLESPPTENGHSLSEIISTVLPENAAGTDDSQQSGQQQQQQQSSSNAKRGPGNHHPSHNPANNVHNGNGHGHDVFAQQNRAPGSQFRNGSITVRNSTLMGSYLVSLIF